jgi:hypothetical protein
MKNLVFNNPTMNFSSHTHSHLHSFMAVFILFQKTLI